MNIILQIVAFALLSTALIAMAAVACKLVTRQQLVSACNIAAGTHEGSVTRLADAAIATRYLLVKKGSDGSHVAVNAKNNRPLGVCDDEAAAAEDPVNVNLLGISPRTLLVVANAAIAVDTEVFTADNGKVSALSATAGTYYKVGRLLAAADADGDVVEIEPCYPVATVVS